MNIYNISISYKTAPVEIRELLAFQKEEKKDFIKAALQKSDVRECVLITTCNRTEVYAAGGKMAADQIMQLLVERKNLNYDHVIKYYLRYQNEKAVKHLFQVICGLDSMLIGEDEILGQVKDDYQLALQAGTTDFLLNTLFRIAITCAKKVKTDTKISKTSISIGTLAANEVFRFSDKAQVKKVLIIGLSGKFGTIVMKNLYHNKSVKIMGTIRNHNIPDELVISYPEVKMIDYNKRYDTIKDADIIISATSSPHYTITSEELKKYISDKKERLFIDLAVPTDIDKNIEKLENVKLIDIDYFKQIAEVNNNLKHQEIEAAKIIIDKQVDEFYKEINFRNFIPCMNELKEVFENQSFESIMYKIRNQVTNDELKVIIQSFTKLIENK
ncbi:glutamyl-tRNA reductase [Anaerocolumna sedimenticola]|uniref:Glutamyl-tRNA reductase n=1 Tax=Anaerocolumna sedimenticola TaxID=2696063 RepID=A0A6P1TRA5_9FIRM|nr:glutamyl-tRNA reductase [Anaerocolumna sedimenticola]QHQ62441.1 glutamyl-tRNA reductase [Anaerocolumna sedimenticola]